MSVFYLTMGGAFKSLNLEVFGQRLELLSALAQSASLYEFSYKKMVLLWN